MELNLDLSSRGIIGPINYFSQHLDTLLQKEIINLQVVSSVAQVNVNSDRKLFWNVIMASYDM